MEYQWVKRGDLAETLEKAPGDGTKEKPKTATLKPFSASKARFTEADAKKFEMDFVENAFLMTLSTDQTDRYRDIIEVKGWEVGDFMRAGAPLLWAHQSRTPPIGAVHHLRLENSKTEGKSRVRGVAAFHRETDLSRETFTLVDGGHVRAGSVGFVPLQWEMIRDAEDEWTGGIRFIKQDLIEHSITPTPANPGALIGRSFPAFTKELSEFAETQGDYEAKAALVAMAGGTAPQIDTLGLPEMVKSAVQEAVTEAFADVVKQTTAAVKAAIKDSVPEPVSGGDGDSEVFLTLVE